MRRRQQIEPLLTFLPELDAGTFEVGAWQGGEPDADGVIQMPWFERSPRLDALVAAIGAAGLVTPGFDWMRWLDSPEGAAMRDEPGRIERATEVDLEHLFTAIIRGDRFSEGNIAGAIESGVMARAVRRLEQLTREAESGSRRRRSWG